MPFLYRLERPSLGGVSRVGAEAPHQRPGARVAPAVVQGASCPGVDEGVAAGRGNELPALGGRAVGGGQRDVRARHRQGEPAGGGGEEPRALVVGEVQDGRGLGHGASGGRRGDARGRVYGAHDPVGAVGGESSPMLRFGIQLLGRI